MKIDLWGGLLPIAVYDGYTAIGSKPPPTFLTAFDAVLAGKISPQLKNFPKTPRRPALIPL